MLLKVQLPTAPSRPCVIKPSVRLLAWCGLPRSKLDINLHLTGAQKKFVRVEKEPSTLAVPGTRLLRQKIVVDTASASAKLYVILSLV